MHPSVIFLSLFLLYDPLENDMDKVLQTFFLLIIFLTFLGGLMFRLLEVPFDSATIHRGYSASGMTLLLVGLGLAMVLAYVFFILFDVKEENQRHTEAKRHGSMVLSLEAQINDTNDYQEVLQLGERWLDSKTEGGRRPVVVTSFRSSHHPEVLKRCEYLQQHVPALRNAYFHSQSSHECSPTRTDQNFKIPADQMKKAWTVSEEGREKDGKEKTWCDVYVFSLLNVCVLSVLFLCRNVDDLVQCGLQGQFRVSLQHDVLSWAIMRQHRKGLREAPVQALQRRGEEETKEVLFKEQHGKGAS